MKTVEQLAAMARQAIELGKLQEARGYMDEIKTLKGLQGFTAVDEWDASPINSGGYAVDPGNYSDDEVERFLPHGKEQQLYEAACKSLGFEPVGFSWNGAMGGPKFKSENHRLAYAQQQKAISEFLMTPAGSQLQKAVGA